MKNFLLMSWGGVLVAVTLALFSFFSINLAASIVEAQESGTAIVAPEESPEVRSPLPGRAGEEDLPAVIPTSAIVVATPTLQSPVEHKIAPAPDFDMRSSIFRMIQGLALCVGLLLLLVWLQKRTQSKSLTGAGRALKVVERLQTGGKTQVLLISVRGREYLIGQGSDSVNIYGEVVHDELADEEVTKKI